MARGAGQHHEVGVGQLRPGAVAKRTSTPGSAASASTSVKFDIRGQPDDRDPQDVLGRSGGRGRLAGAAPTSRESSASSQTAGSHGRTPSTGRPVSRAQHRRGPGCSSRTSPRNLLITKPAISAWSAGVEQGQRAVQRGEHAAAVDVADHDDRQAGRAGQAHVGEVGRPAG